MNKKIIMATLVLLIGGACFGQKYIYSQYKDEEEKLPRISNLWRAGRYLIYDCLEQSYICVSKKSFDLCQKRREKTKEKKSYVLACAPLKKKETYENCLESQYLLIGRITDKRFCRNFEALL